MSERSLVINADKGEHIVCHAFGRDEMLMPIVDALNWTTSESRLRLPKQMELA